MVAAPKRILSYVVASDTGLAPNVTGGICTLAVCKPNIRAHAEPGDWIVGMSKASHGRQKMIYAMQVYEKISYDQFFHDSRFEQKKPTYQAKGDNFFHAHADGYRMAFRSAAHADKPEAIARDLKVPEVVVGHRFWYFGANAPTLPESLSETRIALPDATRRGHRVTKNTDAIATFTDWIGQWEPGIHGTPRDSKSSQLVRSERVARPPNPESSCANASSNDR